MSIVISTDPNKLDIDVIHEFLNRSYWAKGRTKTQIQTTIENCLNFGVYLDGNQIGFARILTDYTVFAYLMDVFILEEHRGKGYSKQLMYTITSHPDLQEVGRWMLGTHDAHGLYQQFGFEALQYPSRWMSKLVTQQK
ncbi:GNAT family N-acetyltransferase [Aquimarina sp. D1M17]|uniref:GNAT family N-acetyltransferase n=1 Tax=Aquimarina acroporae TaxID=2937283 RepID=UPI0020BE39BD|nr:GNAT family N-acetyltransferase [Aquimarina acroporae]MCK8521066.1 GNAT family N-acetyltransferase [Aquimarina acroporae]